MQKTIQAALDKAEEFKHMVNRDATIERLDIASPSAPTSSAPATQPETDNIAKSSIAKDS